MSTDNHDQTKFCKTPARSEEENTFDGKCIKKERSDTCVENGNTVITTTTTTTSSATILEKRQPLAGRFASNGFHGDSNQLYDLVTTKFTTLANHSASCKQDKIRIMIEDGIRLSRF